LFKAFVEAHDHLQGLKDWSWEANHVNEYMNLPWSKVPVLSQFWHRDVPCAGNGNTVNLSKFKYVDMAKNDKIKANASAGTKLLISHDDSEQDLWSIDTGMNGNLFAGHYFDQN
jgi:hypothetical protein